MLPEYAMMALHSRQTIFFSSMITPWASAGKPKYFQTSLLALALAQTLQTFRSTMVQCARVTATCMGIALNTSVDIVQRSIVSSHNFYVGTYRYVDMSWQR